MDSNSHFVVAARWDAQGMLRHDRALHYVYQMIACIRNYDTTNFVSIPIARTSSNASLLAYGTLILTTAYAPQCWQGHG